jgi:hypothetical protein
LQFRREMQWGGWQWKWKRWWRRAMLKERDRPIKRPIVGLVLNRWMNVKCLCLRLREACSSVPDTKCEA